MKMLKICQNCLENRTSRSLMAALFAFFVITPIAVRGLLRSTACIEPVLLQAQGVNAADVKLISPLGSPIDILEAEPGVFTPWTLSAVGGVSIEGQHGESSTVKIILGDSAVRVDGVIISSGQEEEALAPLRRGSRLSGYFNGAINYRGDFWVGCWGVTNGLLIGLLTFFVIYNWSLLVSVLRECFTVVLSPVTLLTALPLVIVLGMLGTRNSDSLALSYRYVDEWIILEGILNWRQFWSALYGSLYNSVLLLASLPGLIADDLQLVVIGQRLVSAAAAAWSVALVVFMASGFMKRPLYLLAALPLLGMPGFWTEASIIRPDWPMTFLGLLTFALLLRDQGQYGMSFLAAVAAFSAALAIKLHALMLSPALIIYVGLSYREPGLVSRILRMGLVFACVYPLLDFELLLLGNSIDLVSIIFKIIMAQSGVGQLAVKLPSATVGQKMLALDLLFISPWVLFAVQMLGVAGGFQLCTNRKMRGVVAAVGTALAISVHHVFLLTLALPTYSVIWVTLVTAASVMVGLALLQKWLSPTYSSTVATGLLAGLAVAGAVPRTDQFRLIAADYYVSVGEGVELQQQTWQRIKRLIGLRMVDRVSVLSSALVCLDTDMVYRKSFDLTRIWYDNMRVVQANRDYLQKFDIIVLKIRGQERVSEKTLEKLLEALPACGFKLAFKNSMVSVWARPSQFSGEALD